MPENKNTDSAFPVHTHVNLDYSEHDAGASHGKIYSHGGLTKREYFAAKALQGICADSLYRPSGGDKDFAKLAVGLADALIEELAK
jgi:hypothetical protein